VGVWVAFRDLTAPPSQLATVAHWPFSMLLMRYANGISTQVESLAYSSAGTRSSWSAALWTAQCVLLMWTGRYCLGSIKANQLICLFHCRYRNFRTFTSPNPVQFSCVAVDYSGEFVVAGGQDVFDIFLWSVKTGKLLEIISGHEGPVVSLAFSPVATSSTLVSGSLGQNGQDLELPGEQQRARNHWCCFGCN